jgi:hypothetical protein
MSRIARGGILLALCLVVVAGLVLTGCGKKEAALQEPQLELTNYVKGSTVDFDTTTLQTMAQGGGEAGFKYGIMKAIYPTLWGSNKDTVAQTLFPSPYWRGDGVHTYYSYLTSADQTTVDGYIYASKLSAAEQAIVVSAVDGLFNRQTVDTSAAKALEQNTAYGILLATDSTGTLAGLWKTDATAWMAALNTKAAADYSGKTYAQLSLAEKAAVTGAMTIITPELALYRAMVQTSFRNGTASATYPDVAEQMATAMYSKAYAALNPMLEKPRVDGAVWAQLTAAEQTNVTTRVAGIFNLAVTQVTGAVDLTSNVYYGILLASAGGQAAADAWKAMVEPTTPGTGAEATAFYTILGAGDPAVGQAAFKEGLTQQYYGAAATYAGLTTASKAVIDQSDAGTAGLSSVQRLPAGTLTLSQNVLYSTLTTSVSSAAATGWATDVTNGNNAISQANLMEWALYKWMAYESFRNGTAASFYPTQVADKVAAAKTAGYISATTYAACNAYEKAVVNGMVWAALGTYEQGYVETKVLPGMFGLIQAEMTDAVGLEQSICYLTLAATTVTSANNFKADVESGVFVKQALYRWLAMEKVKEMASSALMIQESVGEFYIKITNPNKYEISIDQLKLYFKTTAGTSTIDGARQSLGGIWIPAEETVELKVLAPTKSYDLVSWLAMVGTDTTAARSMAAEVWSKIQNGTITWTLEYDVEVSHGNDIQSYSYPA